MDERSTASAAHSPLIKKAFVLTVSALGLGVVFDYLFYGNIPGVSVPIYIVLVLAAVFGIARYTGTKIPKTAALTAIPLLFFSSMVAVWAGDFLTFLNIVASLYLFGLMLYLVFKPDIQNFKMWDYARLLYKLPFMLSDRALGTLVELAGLKQMVAKHEKLPQILRGVLIALPVIAIFIALFASADLVFRKYAEDVFSLDLGNLWSGKLFVLVIITLLFTGVFGYLAKGPAAHHLKTKEPKPVKQGAWHVETAILLSSLNVLFLCFIVVQLTYLFGGQDAITHQGFTYAEYARKGYFELIAVAIMTFGLVIGADKAALRGSIQHSKNFKILATALIAQVLIIMISAFNRLSLYESAYGFTTLRLNAHICIIWLAVLFGLVLYKLWVNNRESTFALLVFLSVITLLVGINVVNPEKYVAHRNVARYYATGKIDLYYLRDLSPDATPETVKLLDAPNKKLADAWAVQQYYTFNKLESARKPWQSANISRSRALNLLDGHKDQMKQQWDKPYETGQVPQTYMW